MKRLASFGTVVVLILAASGLLMAQAAPSGTYKQSIEKSTPQPKNPQIRTMSVNGDVQQYNTDAIAGNGNKVSWSYTAAYDGKPSPITGAGPMGADAVALTHIDASTTQEVFTKAGAVVETTISVVSDGGKTLTVTATGTNAAGNPFKNVLVFDRQ
jgi:hypothetical protein